MCWGKEAFWAHRCHSIFILFELICWHINVIIVLTVKQSVAFFIFFHGNLLLFWALRQYFPTNASMCVYIEKDIPLDLRKLKINIVWKFSADLGIYLAFQPKWQHSASKKSKFRSLVKYVTRSNWILCVGTKLIWIRKKKKFTYDCRCICHFQDLRRIRKSFYT